MTKARLRKNLRIALGVLCALAVLAALAVALEWLSLSKAPSKVELISQLSLSSAKPSLGDAVTAKALFRCDWPTRLASLSVEPGAGTQLSSSASLSLKSLSWGRKVCELDIPLQPFRAGSTGEGSAHLVFSKASGSPDEFDLKIPAFKVEPLKSEAGAELSLAGKMKARAPLWVWLVAGGLLAALLGLGAWLVWKRVTRRLPPPPPWTAACDALAALRLKLAANPAAAASCLSELTDILRRYLEARFQLHARTQTSFEFLSGLDRGDGPLSASHRSFLKEFLMAADMVKFALAEADKRLLDDAILRAEKLVLETVPAPEPGSAKGGAK